MTSFETKCECGSSRLLTITQAANEAPLKGAVSKATLQRLVTAGRFPCLRIGEKKVLINKTTWCPVHLVKETDDIDLWKASVHQGIRQAG